MFKLNKRLNEFQFGVSCCKPSVVACVGYDQQGDHLSDSCAGEATLKADVNEQSEMVDGTALLSLIFRVSVSSPSQCSSWGKITFR